MLLVLPLLSVAMWGKRTVEAFQKYSVSTQVTHHMRDVQHSLDHPIALRKISLRNSMINFPSSLSRQVKASRRLRKVVQRAVLTLAMVRVCLACYYHC